MSTLGVRDRISQDVRVVFPKWTLWGCLSGAHQASFARPAQGAPLDEYVGDSLACHSVASKQTARLLNRELESGHLAVLA
jgi:hypothetical protein